MEDERDITDILLHMAASDEVDLSFTDDDMKAKLTPRGLAEAEELAGGHDVCDCANEFMCVLRDYGDFFGNRIEIPDIPSWLKLVQVCRILKQAGVSLEAITVFLRRIQAEARSAGEGEG
jgi:hypothetical protein